MKASDLAGLLQERFPVIYAAVDTKIVAGQGVAGSVVAGSLSIEQTCGTVGPENFVTITQLGVMFGMIASGIISYFTYLRCKTEKMKQADYQLSIDLKKRDLQET